MEWKKISSMEYGKIVFHSIPYHALTKAFWSLIKDRICSIQLDVIRKQLLKQRDLTLAYCIKTIRNSKIADSHTAKFSNAARLDAIKAAKSTEGRRNNRNVKDFTSSRRRVLRKENNVLNARNGTIFQTCVWPDTCITLNKLAISMRKRTKVSYMQFFVNSVKRCDIAICQPLFTPF